MRVLTDPVLRGRIGPLVRIAPPVDAPGRVDAVALSHLHADHADIPTLRGLERSGPLLAPRPAAEWLQRAGLKDIHELEAGEGLSIGGVTVVATPAVHDRRRRPLGPAADPVGYVVRGSRSAYFAGDTDLFASMADLGDSLDLALLPVWGWGPDAGEGHLDPERAAQAARDAPPEDRRPDSLGDVRASVGGAAGSRSGVAGEAVRRARGGAGALGGGQGAGARRTN